MGVAWLIALRLYLFIDLGVSSFSLLLSTFPAPRPGHKNIAVTVHVHISFYAS